MLGTPVTHCPPITGAVSPSGAHLLAERKRGTKAGGGPNRQEGIVCPHGSCQPQGAGGVNGAALRSTFWTEVGVTASG